MTDDKVTEFPPQQIEGSEQRSLETETSKLSVLLFVGEDTRQWILQADTKGGFLLTINGVVTGFMVQQIARWLNIWSKGEVSAWIPWMLLVIFVLYGVCQLYAFWHTTLVFVPRTPASQWEQIARTRHVFNYSLAKYFPNLSDIEKLQSEYAQLSIQDLEREYLARLHVDSLVCTAKYVSFSRAFRGTLLTLFLALLGFLGNAIFIP